MCVLRELSAFPLHVSVRSPCSVYTTKRHTVADNNASAPVTACGKTSGKWGLVVSKSGCTFIWFGCGSIKYDLSQQKHLSVTELTVFLQKPSQVKICTVCPILEYSLCPQTKSRFPKTVYGNLCCCASPIQRLNIWQPGIESEQSSIVPLLIPFKLCLCPHREPSECWPCITSVSLTTGSLVSVCSKVLLPSSLNTLHLGWRQDEK